MCDNTVYLQVFEIVLSRGYSEANFREDLKTLYLKLGIENKKMVFLFTDAHVAEEGFLELINNMLTSGEAYSQFKIIQGFFYVMLYITLCKLIHETDV